LIGVDCSVSASWSDTGDGVVAYFRGYETPENRMYWWIVDYTCDVIYILDIVFVKRRLQFINNGLREVRTLPFTASVSQSVSQRVSK